MATRYDHFSSQALWSCVAVLLVVACYWNSLRGDLVHDDIFAIRDNQDLLPDTPLSHLLLHDFWGEPMSSVVSHKSYRPLTVLTFRINYLLHSLQPWGYHLVNLLLHALATVLFGWFCRREVFRRERKGEREGERGGEASVVAMLMFSTHPVHTEAVSAYPLVLLFSNYMARSPSLVSIRINIRALNKLWILHWYRIRCKEGDTGRSLQQCIM